MAFCMSGISLCKIWGGMVDYVLERRNISVFSKLFHDNFLTQNPER